VNLGDSDLFRVIFGIVLGAGTLYFVGMVVDLFRSPPPPPEIESSHHFGRPPPQLPHHAAGWWIVVGAFILLAVDTGWPWLPFALSVAGGAVVYNLFRLNSQTMLRDWHRTVAENEEAVRIAFQTWNSLHLPLPPPWPFENDMERDLFSGSTTPDLIADFYRGRLEAEPGVTLGFQESRRYPPYRTEEPLPPAPMKISTRRRLKHVYAIGKTGAGKTNFLAHLIHQDLAAGNGLAVLTPDPDLLVDLILPAIPESRLDDVVYFNPADTEHPIPFNPLQLDPGEDLDLRVDETFAIFKRLLNFEGARMEPVLRHTLYALLERPGSTFLDVQPFLDPQDSTFRQEVLHASNNGPTRHFFETLYPQLARDTHIPITMRLSDFALSKYVRNMLCSSRPSPINFRELMDTRKIILFNLSDGLLGERNSQLLGNLVVSRLQLAALSRADTPENHRVPFFLYVDEFTAFTGQSATSYGSLLSRGRKYRLSLTLAHQQTGQLSPTLFREILGNVGTLACFTLAHADSTRLAKEFDGTFEPSRLTSLPIGKAYIKTGRTYLLVDVPHVRPPADSTASRAIERSRANWSVRPELTRLPDPPPGASETPLDPEDVF